MHAFENFTPEIQHLEVPVTLNMMRQQVLPEWEITTATTTTTTTGTTSSEEVDFQYEDLGLHPADFVQPDPQTDGDHSCWNIRAITATADDHNFQEIFEDLPNIQPELEPWLQMQATPNYISSQKEFLRVCDVEKGESSGKQNSSSALMETKSVLLSGDFVQKQGQRPKRSRVAELHNMSERKRRNRITEKSTALQELIPNCNKTDRASVLEQAIKYIKALKLQVQMMSMAGGAQYQASNLSLAGIESTQMPQFMPYLPVGPGLGASHAYGMGMGIGMGMVNMCYSAGLPPLYPSSAGLPLMPAPGVLQHNPQLQMPMPFLASQVLPSAATTSNILQPQLATDFSQTFNYANQGEYTSQNNAKDAATDGQTMSQKFDRMASHIVAPLSSTSDKKVTEFNNSSGCDNSR